MNDNTEQKNSWLNLRVLWYVLIVLLTIGIIFTAYKTYKKETVPAKLPRSEVETLAKEPVDLPGLEDAVKIELKPVTKEPTVIIQSIVEKEEVIIPTVYDIFIDRNEDEDINELGIIDEDSLLTTEEVDAAQRLILEK